MFAGLPGPARHNPAVVLRQRQVLPGQLSYRPNHHLPAPLPKRLIPFNFFLGQLNLIHSQKVGTQLVRCMHTHNPWEEPPSTPNTTSMRRSTLLSRDLPRWKEKDLAHFSVTPASVSVLRLLKQSKCQKILLLGSRVLF